MHSSFLFTAAFASIALAQYTTTMAAVSQVSDGQPQAPTAPPGSMTVSSYSAHPPYYTPSYVDTATMPAISAAPSYTSSASSAMTRTSSMPWVITSASTSYVVPTQPGTNYNSTYVPMVTAGSSPVSSYTMVSSTMPTPSTLSLASSAAVAAATTGPVIPISSTNTGVFRRVAGTGLALAVAGSLFSVLL